MKSVNQLLDELASFKPTTFPVISLYLDARAGAQGRDNFESFVRSQFKAVAQTYPEGSPERESIESDVKRIGKYLAQEVEPATNGVAVFACAAENGFFEAIQLETPFEEHKLYVYHQPHLFLLARLADQYRRYAALVADTNAARLFVFALGATQSSATVEGEKTNRTERGGWSQARYQRRAENYHVHHAKEVVEKLAEVVSAEQIDRIVLAGDAVIVPLLQAQLPKPLAEKVIDVLSLDMRAPEHEILAATLEATRKYDLKDDAAKVQHLFDEYRAGGLAVVGPQDALVALTNGQGDELVISAGLEEFHLAAEEVNQLMAPHAPLPEDTSNAERRQVLMADALVTRARQTGARVSFIEDQSLLAQVGGVGVLLRYRV